MMEFKTSEGRIEIDAKRDGSSFSFKGMKIHTGEELYACSKCNKAF